MRFTLIGLFVALLIVVTGGTRAATTPTQQTEIDALRNEVEDLRKKVMAQTSSPAARSSVDTVLENRFGPNATATTHTGKLTLGGLVQVWYYHIANDNRGLFDSSSATHGLADSNEASDNDSFRIRRAELSFNMEIHENIRAYVMIDPAREAASFPDLPIGTKRLAHVSPEFAAKNPALSVGADTSLVRAVQTGAGASPNLLQDALINYHGVIPHHDFTVGQYLPTFNEEDFSPNSTLDFAERSWIGNQFARDLGATIHGSWWGAGGGGAYCGGGDQGRFQYWLSIFDGAGDYHQTSGQSQNRSDDNDQKDYLATMLVRPLWTTDCDQWRGKLELGGSVGFGMHGKDGGSTPDTTPTDGLNRRRTEAYRYGAWFKYMPGGPVRGLWLKGEANLVSDDAAPDSIADLAGHGTGISPGLQQQGDAFRTYGGWGAVGYRISDSVYSDCSWSWMKPIEIAARAETAQNVWIADPANDTHTNVYRTLVFSPEINYYIKGHNAKVQLMYNIVRNPRGPESERFHNTSDDSFIMNFQVMW